MSGQFTVRRDCVMIIKWKGNQTMRALPVDAEEIHEISHSNTPGTSQDSNKIPSDYELIIPILSIDFL
jgi:hypothetical protein